MGKSGCPVCSKAYGAGHWSISDCPQLKTPVTVERIPKKELPTPKASEGSLTSEHLGRLTEINSRLTEPEGRLTSRLTSRLTAPTIDLDGSLTKQQRYRRVHPDWYRTYQREYMRRRRA